MPVRHRPTVRTIGATDLHGPRYQSRCTCGTAGPERTDKKSARADRDAHVAALGTPAPERRCRDPHAHRTRPWEDCAVCAAQLALFDL
jgi:hypothetical protein